MYKLFSLNGCCICNSPEYAQHGEDDPGKRSDLEGHRRHDEVVTVGTGRLDRELAKVTSGGDDGWHG